MSDSALLPSSLEYAGIPVNKQAKFFLALLALLLSWGFVGSSTANAQANPPDTDTKQYPSREYYLAKALLENGQADEALAGCQDALRNAWRVGNIRFVDSIAPAVLAGECYYQQGNLTAAIKQYEIAMTMAIDFVGWSARVNATGQGGVTANANNTLLRGIQWSNNARGTSVVRFPQFVPTMVGQLDFQEVIQRGGVAIPAELIRLDLGEILRMLALAQYRRNCIAGPLTARYPLTAKFRDSLLQEPGTGIAWIDAGLKVNIALAEQANGDNQAALVALGNAQSTPDRFDHYCTPIALLAQAELQLLEGNYPAANKTLIEASLVAAQLEQHHILADIVYRMGGVATYLGDQTQGNTFQAIANWSRKQARLPTAFAMSAAAELSATSGNHAAGDTFGKNAMTLARGRDISLPRVLSQVAYASAHSSFARGQINAGAESLQNALLFYRGNKIAGPTSIWQYRVLQTSDLYQRDVIGIDETRNILNELLQDDPFLWSIEPLEALIALDTPNPEAWSLLQDFELRRLPAGKYPEIFERLGRQRFYSALPWRHRLLAIRQLYMRPLSELDESQVALRQRWDRVRPDLALQTKRLVELTNTIKAQPVTWERSALSKAELMQYKELEVEASKLESLFQKLAISRVVIPDFIADDISVSDLQKRLGAEQAVLKFALIKTTGSSRLEAYLVTAQKMQQFELASPQEIAPKLIRLLTSLGLGRDKNRKLVLDDQKLWQDPAKELRDTLLTPELITTLESYPQLIIVPDDWLWYIPFSAFPAAESDGQRWSEKYQLAFSPLLSLSHRCLGAQSRKTKLESQAAANGGVASEWEAVFWDNNFFGGIDEAEESKRIQELEQDVSGLKSLSPAKEIVPLPLYRIRPNSFLVAARSGEVNDNLARPWITQDKAKSLTSWRDSLSTPMMLPEYFWLPGWTSSASILSLDNGDDLFLPATAMLLCGTKQGLLHRWPGAGTASHSLMKRFLAESAELPPAVAWQRSLTALWAEEFPPTQEDALLGADYGKTLIPGSHAILWSGYLPIGQWLEETTAEADIAN